MLYISKQTHLKILFLNIFPYKEKVKMCVFKSQVHYVSVRVYNEEVVTKFTNFTKGIVNQSEQNVGMRTRTWRPGYRRVCVSVLVFAYIIFSGSCKRVHGIRCVRTERWSVREATRSE